MTYDEALKNLKGLPHISDTQGRALYEFVRREKPRCCLELGHAHGVSSAYIAAALDEVGGHLDTVDLELSADLTPNLETLLARMGLSRLVSIHREVNSYTWFLKKKIAARSSDARCLPCYDFCFIDGAKNWTIDGLAFFLVDKLLNDNGWILFDDYSWTYEKYLRRKEVLDGITIRKLGPDERAEPHVAQIFQLLVRQHPSYSNFTVQSNWWAWAQKTRGGRTNVATDHAIGQGF
jgi:predicted O-methyltransferase YrrM